MAEERVQLDGRELEVLRAKEGTSFAHAHPSDLERWGVADGDLVDITSPRSTLRTVIKAALDVKPGSVSMAHSWGDLPGEAGPTADPRVLGDTTGASPTAPAPTTRSPGYR